MISFSVFYPYKEGANFDFDYYQNNHLGILKRYFGDTCKGITVLKGNVDNKEEPDFMCVCNISFDSEKQFLEIMEKAEPELLADIKNYTNIEPYTQIFEISMQE
jgi:uncharacterized protein (TIGR02118 family)